MNPAKTLRLALQHHEAGRLAEAEKLYRRILAAQPRQADALHFLGVIADQSGRTEDAVRMIGKSIAIMPDNPAAHSNLGNALRDQGRLEEAAAAYRTALALMPGHAEAHCNLGNVLRDQCQPDDAEASYRRAIELKPELVAAHHSLGNLLLSQGRSADAVASLGRALRLAPGVADLWNNLGAALQDLGRYDEAIAACREAARLDPGSGKFHNNLGNALKGSGQLAAAVDSYRRALEIRPDLAEAWNNLGHTLKEAGQPDEAISAFRRAAELRPDVPGYRYVLAGLTGEQSESAAPASFVRQLFDEYAVRFDDHLVGRLGYEGPALLLAAVSAVAPGREFDVMDLGCGTGLCGVAIRPRARTLAGVDLAPKMIEKAAARGIYDQLIVGDVLGGLQDRVAAFDLVMAGDVFIYVGDLAGVFGAARRALRDDGLLAFSVERHDGEGFVLERSVRFAHSLAYLRTLAQQHDLAEELVREVTLRQDGGRDIAGWIVVLRKPAAR